MNANPAYNLMEAMSGAITEGQNLQLQQALTTQANVNAENSVYSYWQEQIDAAAAAVTADAAITNPTPAQQNQLVADQTTFQLAQTNQTTYGGLAEAATQSSSSYTGTISSLLQTTINDLSSAVTSIPANTSSLLAKS